MTADNNNIHNNITQTHSTELQFQPVAMSTVLSDAATTPPVTASAAVAPITTISDGSSVGHRSADAAKLVSNGKHVSLPQIDVRSTRRQEMMNRPSSRDLMAYQHRQQQGRSNSAVTVPPTGDRGNRAAGQRSPVSHGNNTAGAGSNGGNSGSGFKNKLRNSFRSTSKRIRQQQTAINALAKNSQMLGLHNLQESPRMGAAQRTPVSGRVRILMVFIIWSRSSYDKN